MPEEAPAPPAHTGIARRPKRPCRYLTVHGVPCRQNALIGKDYCVQHEKYRHPVCPSGPNAVIPLIENLETIQLITSQVTQGLFSESLDPLRAGKILYACQVAAMTIPRPARLEPVKSEPAEPLTEVFESPDGELLGPAEFKPGERARFDYAWSYDKHRYEEECERLGRPLPETPADMPESGWLNPDDLDNLNQQVREGKMLLDDGYRDKILELHIDADRRGALPPLADRKCAYGDESWCHGPGAQGDWRSACSRCIRERDEYCRLHPDEPAPRCHSDIRNLQAVASPAPGPRLSRLSTPRSPSPATRKSCLAVIGGTPLGTVRFRSSAVPQVHSASDLRHAKYRSKRPPHRPA